MHSLAALEHLPCARPCPWGWGFSGEQNIVLTQGLCGTLRMEGHRANLGQASFFFLIMSLVEYNCFTVVWDRLLKGIVS